MVGLCDGTGLDSGSLAWVHVFFRSRVKFVTHVFWGKIKLGYHFLFGEKMKHKVDGKMLCSFLFGKLDGFP